ncbi:MAG: serine hydrolase [Pseudomonadales bacterium]|nr:serine hydrolase [Pseudomonadales bacterium]
MPDKEFFRASPQDLGCSRDRLDILRQRVRRDVESGLLPAAQLAVARDGRIGWFETFGNADDDTLFCVFSCTKALISSAAWLLVESGQLVPAELVSEVIPGLSTSSPTWLDFHTHPSVRWSGVTANCAAEGSRAGG